MAGFIAVHTGAGNCIDETKYQRVIKEACAEAIGLMRGGGSAMDGCEIAVMRLENCGYTNAGFGSNLSFDGHVQCDASIMNGSNLQFGACTNVSSVKNPIELARKICDGQLKMLSFERLPPMVMAGAGAEQYATELGCTMIDPRLLISAKARVAYNHYKSKYESSYKSMMAAQNGALDTVGAVCVDGNGNTAAACSSGGLLMKVAGRVGQAATYGAGCWAVDSVERSVATCTTGNGEYLMKTFLAKEICNDLLITDFAVASLQKTYKTKFFESPYLPQGQELYGGSLSIIYYPEDYCGELLWSHTTKSICVGYMSTTQKHPQFVYSTLPTYSLPGKSCAVNGHNFHLRF